MSYPYTALARVNLYYFHFFFTTQVFADLRELEELDLHFNMIVYVAPHAFYGLAKLETLDMNANMMTSIPPFTFSHLSSVKELRISHNMIEEIGMAIFNREKAYLANFFILTWFEGLVTRCSKSDILTFFYRKS